MRIEQLAHSRILIGYPLVEPGLGDVESQRHASVTAPRARVVRHDHVRPLQSDQLAHAEVAVEREQQGDGGSVVAGFGHRRSEYHGQLPRQWRMRLSAASSLPAAKSQPGLAEFEAQLRPSEHDSVDGVRRVVEGPAQRVETFDVLREAVVHGARRDGEEGAHGEMSELEEALEVDGVGA